MEKNAALNHYSRSPKIRSMSMHKENNKNTSAESKNIFDDIVLPPNSEGQNSEYDAIVKPHGMGGTESFFYVPKKTSENQTVLRNYLEKFLGKNVCATLWTNGKNKVEKCGILEEVGIDYITIKENKTKKLLIMTMDKVKYISVFCV